jgi:hypothetical protein
MHVANDAATEARSFTARFDERAADGRASMSAMPRLRPRLLYSSEMTRRAKNGLMQCSKWLCNGAYLFSHTSS